MAKSQASSKTKNSKRPTGNLPLSPVAEPSELGPAVEILRQYPFAGTSPASTYPFEPEEDPTDEFERICAQFVWKVHRDYRTALVEVENNRIEDRKKRQILRRLRSALHSANEIVRSLDADRRIWRPSENADAMTDAEIRDSFQNDAMKAWYTADLMAQCALISAKRSGRKASHPARDEALRRLSTRLDRLTVNRSIPHSDRLKIERAIIRAARLPEWWDAPPPDSSTDQRFATQAHRRRKTAR